jgi:hypothetical protein
MGYNGPARGTLLAETAVQLPDSQATFSGSRCGRLSADDLPSLPTPDRLLLLISAFELFAMFRQYCTHLLLICQEIQSRPHSAKPCLICRSFL